jgi:Rps23 Pro-64 3,4-dihydroxylase Tpa1-like proline 4-hydroxylase
MSVNSYRKGCHLLNHDDVIDTRRVSYILYMPISGTERGEHEWKADWGGALELYDVTEQDGIKEPKPHPAKVIPPSWNQVVLSFASVLHHLLMNAVRLL